MRPFIASIVGTILLAIPLARVAYAQAAPDCTTQASLRVINASPDVGSVDVLINGQKAITDLKFPTAVSYARVSAGTVKVQANATGTDKAAITATDLKLDPLGRYTAIAMGLVAGAAQAQKPTLSLQLFPDDGTRPAAGKSKMRIIHASPDAGLVDVLANGNKLVEELAYTKASPFLEVAAGKYSVTVNPSGKADAVIGPVELDLVDGRSYTVYATGQASKKTLALNVLVDRTFDAQLLLVNNLTDQTIDSVIDGVRVFSGVPYANTSTFAGIPAGGSCAVVLPAGQATPVLSSIGLDLASASSSKLIVTDPLGGGSGPPVVRVVTTEQAPANPGKARCNVFNGIPDAGPIDLLADGQKVISNLQYADASGYFDVEARKYKIQVNKAGTNEALIGPVDFPFGDRQVLTCILNGRVAKKPDILVLNDPTGG